MTTSCEILDEKLKIPTRQKKNDSAEKSEAQNSSHWLQFFIAAEPGKTLGLRFYLVSDRQEERGEM